MPTTASIEVTLRAPTPRSRGQVALRALAALAVGQVGPVGLLVFPLAYLIVPLIVAFHLRVDGPEAFVREEVPRLAQGLGWLLALQAWATCLVDRFPLPDERAVLALEVRPSPPPKPATALAALLLNAPRGAAMVLASLVALPVWVGTMACLAVAGRQPAILRAPLRSLLDSQARFLARHAALVQPAARRAPTPGLPMVPRSWRRP